MAKGTPAATDASEDVFVVSVETVEVDEPIEVYDIQVDVDHSFLVGGAVVHNSDICISYSGMSWDLDGNPIGNSLPFNGGPPRHWGCRSVLIPLLKSFRELGVNRDEIPPSTRSSLDGQVAEDLSFNDFLKGKSKTFQNDLLGEGKAQLWRDGKISLTDLLDQKGRPLTLEQLKERH